MIWEKSSPPTTATPSGRRDSAPAPCPSAIGRVPTSAAMVVIMMGRNRTLAASRIASRALLSVVPLGLDGEVDHHDRVLLHDADQHDDADEGVDAEVQLEDHQREQRAEPGEGQARENGERVDEALVQNAEHQVDHQDGEDQQDQQALLRLLERLRRARRSWC